MAQFAGRRGVNWIWVVIVLVVIAAILAYLYVTNPALFSSLQMPS